MKDSVKGILSCVIVIITLIICIKFYNSTKPNAVEVYVDGKPMTYASNREEVIKSEQAAMAKIKQDFNNISLKYDISYEDVRVPESYIENGSSIASLLLCRLNNMQVDACKLSIDGKSIAFLQSKEDAEVVLTGAEGSYISKCGLSEISYSEFMNNWNLSDEKCSFSSIVTKDEALKNILNDNTLKLAYKVKGIKKQDVAISCPTNIIWSSSLYKGQSIVKNPGQDGVKTVSSEVTMENGKVIQQKVIKETIIKKPVGKVIAKGTKDTIVAGVYCLSEISRGGSVTSEFGERWGKMHYGIDIAASSGTPIYAAYDGKVACAEWETGYGNVVKINHANGLQTIYGHCSHIDVKAGQTVKKGVRIAEVGSTGNSTGPHLHFEVRLNGKPQNPLKYLNN
jgi:murein DD-endopeptidase MepM/ murein hydrolase activator NlpD